jgi:small subunit ribosomal protein S1
MSVNMQRREHHAQPEPLDESYWTALLQEGEFSEPPAPLSQVDTTEDFVYQQQPPVQHDNGTIADDWREMQTIMDADLVLELAVVGVNRGGLLVEWRSLRGFVPASQLIESGNGLHPSQRAPLHERVGEKLLLRVIELNAEHNRLILSERAAQAQPGERAHLLTRLEQGAIVTGIVTNLCDFGAFIDLGGLEGLIHISELSWGRVGHPADLLRRGDEVRVYVLDVNADAGRVALSLKRLNDDPWATVHLRYRVNESIEGLITNVVDFGAFVRVEDGLEGLIHVSELAEGHFLHPRNVVSEGQVVRARILTIDGRNRRLGLSLRAMNSNGGS